MNIEYRFLSIAELKLYLLDSEQDSENILKSGIDLYKSAILNNPYGKDNDYALCIAIVDGKIAGRFMLFRTKLKVEDRIIPIITGGGILVSKKYRGIGIGRSLIQAVLKKDFYLGALYTRAAYNIIKETEQMLEIPQYVKFHYQGIKKILDIPVFLKLFLLKKRFILEKLSIVPQWAGDMILDDGHKYMEVHDTSWLQWSLDNNATGNKNDNQFFYAIYDKKKSPVGFFITKIRTIAQDASYYKKANLVEWASSNIYDLDESDINILAYGTLDSSVEKFWTISKEETIGKKLKRYLFQRKGWFAISVGREQFYEDIGDVNQWRIRYGCCNTALVE